MAKGKKGKKGGKKASAVSTLRKVTGDLSEDRVSILLFGFPDDSNKSEVRANHNHSPWEDFMHSDCEKGADDNIVRKRRQIPAQTRHFSHMIEERAASPVISPRYGLSGKDETAWEPYFGKAKCFKDITKDCKEWSNRIRQTLHELKVKRTGDAEAKAKLKAGAPSFSDRNQEILKRIRSQLPDTKSNDTDVVVDLMELSDEMSELRLMLTMEKEELKKMDISPDVIERILFESNQLGRSADQVRLLDVEHTAAGFAKNLRGIWELLYLRATGEFLPSSEKEISEMEELQLRTVDASFAKASPEEVEEEEEDEEEELEEISEVSFQSLKDQEKSSQLQSISMSDSISQSKAQSSADSQNISLLTSVHSAAVNEPSRTSVVLQSLINETKDNIGEPAVVPIKSFDFPMHRSSSGSLQGLSVGFGDEKDSYVEDIKSDGSRHFENYNEILERRTTVYSGMGAVVKEEDKSVSLDEVQQKLHLKGSFHVSAADDEIDAEMKAQLTKSSITQIEMRYSNSSLCSAEEEAWKLQQKTNKQELLNTIKTGNYNSLQKNMSAHTPEPKRTVTTPRTPASRELKVRRSKGAVIVDKRPVFKELKHVSMEFGFAEYQQETTDLAELSEVSERAEEGEGEDEEVREGREDWRGGALQCGTSTCYTPYTRGGMSRQGPASRQGTSSRLQSRQGSPQKGRDRESVPTLADTTIIRFVASPKTTDITASFLPLSTYAQKCDDFISVAQQEATERMSPDGEAAKVVSTKAKVADAQQHQGPVAASLRLKVAGISGSAFTTFDQHHQRTPKYPGQGDQSVIKPKGGRSPRTSPTHQRIMFKSPRSPTRSPTLDTVESIQHAPRAPESKSAGGGRPAAGGVRLKTEGSVQLPIPLSLEEPPSTLQQDKDKDKNKDKEKESSVLHPLDESSVSTMFSIQITMPDPGQKPPDLRSKLKSEVEDTAVGVCLGVSDSFVEQNTARAMKSLPHRPIKRVAQMTSGVSEIPSLDAGTGEQTIQTTERSSLPCKDPPDEILNIVGNVSPRVLETEPVIYAARPSTTPASISQHQHASHHTSQHPHASLHVPQFPSQQQPRQCNIKKQTLMLSLPSASLTHQDSTNFLIDNSARFEKPIKRTLSADSFSEFNLSAMSMSVTDSSMSNSVYGKGTAKKKSKASKTVSKSKYLEPAVGKKSSTVYYSKLKSESTRNNADFVVKYPVQVKGMECEEIYYNSQTGHIVISTIALDQSQPFSTIDMPIEDVVVTYGAFEGTLTLRCNPFSDSAPEDYLATIKADDWRRIIAQMENGLKRNYAISHNHKKDTEVDVPSQPESDIIPIDKVKVVTSPRTRDRRLQPPGPSKSLIPAHKSVKKSNHEHNWKQNNIKQCATNDEDESTISALQSFMDDMTAFPFAAPGFNNQTEADASVTSDFVKGIVKQTASNPDLDLAFLSGFVHSQNHVDMSGSHSSDELTRSVVSKRNGKGAAPLPIIDDSTEDDNENVFLTGFHLKPQFSVHMEEQNPHDDMLSKVGDGDIEDDRGDREEHEPGRGTKISKQMRKIYRRYPPPLAGHLVNDSDVLVENIISKFNDLHPLRTDNNAILPINNSNQNDLYSDPLPRAVTFADDNSLVTQESPFPLTSKPVMLDESVVAFRQRTAPSRTFVAPDPNRRRPPINTSEQYTRPPVDVPPTPQTYAVLDPPCNDDGTTALNPRRVIRGPSQSTYRTLSAKRPTVSSGQSFKSPRSGKAIKATSHANVFLSNEVDENSSLSKMMEVSNQLLESKAKMLRHLKSPNMLRMSDSIKDTSSVDCTKIELKLSL